MMDPAETEQIHGALSKQGVLLGSHETQFQRLTDAVNQIGDTLQHLQTFPKWPISTNKQRMNPCSWEGLACPQRKERDAGEKVVVSTVGGLITCEPPVLN